MTTNNLSLFGKQNIFEAEYDELPIVKTDHGAELVLTDLIHEGKISRVYRAKILKPAHLLRNGNDLVVKLASEWSMTNNKDAAEFARLSCLQEDFMFRQFPKFSPEFSRHVPRIYDVIGLIDTKRVPGIVVEELRGGSWEDREQTFQEELETCIEAGTIIGEIHDNGFVHRDIAEKNFYFREPYCEGKNVSGLVLIDGGFAYHKDSYLMRELQKGFILGTPPYMDAAAISGDIMPESDIYALGIIIAHRLACENLGGEHGSVILSKEYVFGKKHVRNEHSKTIPHLDELLFDIIRPRPNSKKTANHVVEVLQDIHFDLNQEYYVPEYAR